MKPRAAIPIAILLAALALPCVGERRDALNSKETDQLRDANQDPAKRLKLLVEFAHARLAQVEQLRSDPRSTVGRGPQVHDLVEDFGNIVDEMDDNLDMYAEHKADLRKPLKEIIQADSEFQSKIGAIQQSLGSAAFADESRDYQFVVGDALESIRMSLDHARKLLDEENEAFAKKK